LNMEDFLNVCICPMYLLIVSSEHELDYSTSTNEFCWILKICQLDRTISDH
jgi:hypothetical protein